MAVKPQPQNEVRVFIHEPLETDDTIRILRLHPAANHSDPLEFDLEHRRRDLLLADPSHSQFSYDAVSYVLGEANFTHSMRCLSKGTYLQITPSVDTVLRHLRKTDVSRCLWLDAICLNQSFHLEKNKQVQLMGDIYKQAKKVRIWLGEAPDDATQKAFQLIRYLATGQRLRALFKPDDLKGELSHLFGSDLLKALGSLLERPWFTRRWVIQEAMLGHAVVVHCGPVKVAFDWFTDGLKVLLEAADSFGFSETALDALRFTSAISRSDSIDLLDGLWKFHGNDCLDRRDRIFALYGFAGSSYTVPPNYDRNWPDVYISFTATFLRESGDSGLRRLMAHLVAFGSLAEVDPEWPSWVPNWSSRRKTVFSTTNHGFRGATGDTIPYNEILALQMDICILGVVGKTYEAWPEAASRADISEYLNGLDESKSRRPAARRSVRLVLKTAMTCDFGMKYQTGRTTFKTLAFSSSWTRAEWIQSFEDNVLVDYLGVYHDPFNGTRLADTKSWIREEPFHLATQRLHWDSRFTHAYTDIKNDFVRRDLAKLEAGLARKRPFEIGETFKGFSHRAVHASMTALTVDSEHPDVLWMGPDTVRTGDIIAYAPQSHRIFDSAIILRPTEVALTETLRAGSRGPQQVPARFVGCCWADMPMSPPRSMRPKTTSVIIV